MMTRIPTPPLDEISYEAAASAFRELSADWEGRKVAVLGHVRPDGDCIGSQVAMTRMLRNLGCEAVAVNADPIPKILASFVGDTPFLQASEFEYDGHLAITVDCADGRRIGEELATILPEIAFNIDHHISNPGYARHNIVMSSASATAEILGTIFTLSSLPIDPVAAQALYVGIATDTGQFRFNSTTPHTFELCRRLCEYGADPAAASMQLYEQESLGRIQLLQHFLASLRLEFDGRVCIGFLPQGIYEETGTSSEDSEGLVDYARSIEGVAIGVFLEEHQGRIKGSFRCKEPRFRVDAIARELNGGGHACAAGFRVENTIEGFLPSLLNLLEKHLGSLEQAP